MKKITYIFIAMLFSLVACDDKLDLKPSDEIDIDKAFETVEDLDAGLLGVYAMVGDNTLHGLASIASDDVFKPATNTGQSTNTYAWTYTQADGNDAGGSWTGYYHLIDRANRLLAATEIFATDGNQNLVKKVKGEALFLRAYGHFQLLRIFSPKYAADAIGVCVMTESVISSPARETMGAVCTQIEADLASAATFIVDTESRITASKYAVVALQARLALFKGENDKAITSATDVIANSGINIAGTANIDDVWTDANGVNEEVIFKLGRTAGGSTLGSSWNRQGNDDVFFTPSVDILSIFSADDLRNDIYFQDQAGVTIIAKHIGRGGSSEKNLVDVKVLRISEMYLIRAEAYAEKSMLTEAAADIQTIIDGRFVTPATVSYTTKQEAIDGVRLERRKELAFEGNRFYDLKRWNLPVLRTGADCILDECTLPAGDYRFVFPIPQFEMFSNENMVQNDKY